MAGERRLRACKMAKMQTIPAILCDYADDKTAAMGLLENLQRENLNPFEQAQGLRDVMVLWDCTQAEAAKRLGMAQPTLANKLRLLQLTQDQRQFVLDNGLTERHARAVLRLPENRRSERAHHHCQAEDERPGYRLVHRAAAERSCPGTSPHLNGEGRPHFCEYHRPRHPPDDGTTAYRQRHTGKSGMGTLSIPCASDGSGTEVRGESQCSMWNIGSFSFERHRVLVARG